MSCTLMTPRKFFNYNLFFFFALPFTKLSLHVTVECQRVFVFFFSISIIVIYLYMHMYIHISVCNISNSMQRQIVFVFQLPALKKLTFMQNSLICNFSFPTKKKILWEIVFRLFFSHSLILCNSHSINKLCVKLI